LLRCITSSLVPMPVGLPGRPRRSEAGLAY
jgi:hypothetical protein